MEFGRVEQSQLAGIDFTLPPDSDRTNEVLKTSNSGGGLKTYIGLSRYSLKSWVGNIYPNGTKQEEMLTLYSTLYDTVEFSLSFYAIPTLDEVKARADKTINNKRFKYCPKFPQTVTHIRRFRNVESASKQFFESIAGFGAQLGPTMIQLADNFTPTSFIDLYNYLKSVPAPFPIAIEVRNKEYFANIQARNMFFSTLADLNIGTIITDSAGRRDCAHMELTTPHAIVRFVGNDLHKTDYERIDAWVERIKVWEAKGLRTLYFFVHELNENHSPQLASYLKQQLGLSAV